VRRVLAASCVVMLAAMLDEKVTKYCSLIRTRWDEGYTSQLWCGEALKRSGAIDPEAIDPEAIDSEAV
jgi:hypothetical protein